MSNNFFLFHKNFRGFDGPYSVEEIKKRLNENDQFCKKEDIIIYRAEEVKFEELPDSA